MEKELVVWVKNPERINIEDEDDNTTSFIMKDVNRLRPTARTAWRCAKYWALNCKAMVLTGGGKDIQKTRDLSNGELNIQEFLKLIQRSCGI